MKFEGAYTHEKLVRRAMNNAKANDTGDGPRWAAVRDTFAVGSTTAIELCLHYGLNPHEFVHNAKGRPDS